MFQACRQNAGEDPIKATHTKEETNPFEDVGSSRWRPNRAKQKELLRQCEVQPQIRPEINLNHEMRIFEKTFFHLRN
jgi:hypothetical protein